MAIIGTLPNNIQNGQTVDATPVMADFNFIVNQVNANANPIGTLTAASGTRVAFHQASAPVGWVTDTSITDHAMRVSQANGGQIVGSTAYGFFLTGGWQADPHALSIPEMPSHNHGVVDPGHVHGITDPTHNHGGLGGASFLTTAGGGANLNTSGAFSVATPSSTANASTGIGMNTAVTGISLNNTGGASAHVHTLTTSWNYVSLIVAQKS